jgi:hypothetical protein
MYIIFQKKDWAKTVEKGLTVEAKSQEKDRKNADLV